MSTAPGLAIASTAPPAAAPLGEVLRMLPGPPASAWQTGGVLFRGRMEDLAFRSVRDRVALRCELFVAPPGSGKSVLANTIDLGLA